ncbi:PucR family transcriptional regulator [Pseudonocardia sp. DLS-67]
MRWAATHHLDAVGAVVEGDAAGVLAAAEVIPVAGPTVAVGPAVELRHLHESYRVASRVMEVAAQFGRHGPQTLQQLSLRVAVAAEHDIGDVLVDRILAPLLDQGEFGAELVASLDAFLAAGMNTAVAARALVVHPNTLRYRINQVKMLSGITMRSAQETSEVWWALRRHEWVRRTGYRP